MNDNLDFQFSLVIDSDLGDELCKFKNGKSCNTRIIEKLLHYYKNHPIFTKSDFMKRYYYDFPTILNAILSNLTTRFDIDNANSADIAKHTLYKVILTNDRNKQDFPYIYIGGDKIENNFTATFHKGPRDKAKEHLKALLENADTIFIYDKFITNKTNNIDNWQSFIDFVKACFPNKDLNIYYSQDNVTSNHTTRQQNSIPPSIESNNYNYIQDIIDIGTTKNKRWTFTKFSQNNSFNELHDRYLIVDNKIEIILTSGIYHLMHDNKDFTYIVRLYKP